MGFKDPVVIQFSMWNPCSIKLHWGNRFLLHVCLHWGLNSSSYIIPTPQCVCKVLFLMADGRQCLASLHSHLSNGPPDQNRLFLIWQMWYNVDAMCLHPIKMFYIQCITCSTLNGFALDGVDSKWVMASEESRFFKWGQNGDRLGLVHIGVIFLFIENSLWFCAA